MRFKTKIISLSLVFGMGMVSAQGVPQEKINALLEEGEVDKAEKTMKSLLSQPDNMSFQDSLYLLKNLGVLYASNPKKTTEADRLFVRLLELDPFASLHDTYASHTILGRFLKIRKEFQVKKGGKTLIPPVAVFDFQGAGFSAEDRISLTNQFIGEMQKLLIFHTLDRPFVTETFRRMRKTTENCKDRECLLDIARRLMTEYMVMPEVLRIDSVVTFQITLVLVENGQNSTLLRKVFTGSLAKILEDGIPEMAKQLQEQEAAWINLSVQPANTELVLDGSPLIAINSRLPVNPGKHKVCGSSPGYESQCRDFEVNKKDAVTYSIVLKQNGGGQDPASNTTKARENWDDDPQLLSDDSRSESDKGPSKKTVWIVLGGMAALVAALAIVLSVK